MEKNNKYPLLDKIENPSDLRELPEDSLNQVADELREFLIESVSASGGHFAAKVRFCRTLSRFALPI